MNRLVRIIFSIIAGLFLVFAGAFAVNLHNIGEPVLKAKSLWVAIAIAIFFLCAAWRFSRETNFKFFAVLLGLALVEFFLQAASWLAILPFVNTKIKQPYARVYWRSEGLGNSIRNRYGWHYPEFDLKSPDRIDVIGDSFVEAVEVGRDKNESAVLQQLLRRQSTDRAVLAFGTHGTSPAAHLDVLDYAQRHFPAKEVIVILYLGNDLNETVPELNYASPLSYIYYNLDSKGHLVINPESIHYRNVYVKNMERCHDPVWQHLPEIVKSHCMSLQLILSLQDAWRRHHVLPVLAGRDPEAAQWGRIGLSLKPFAVTPDPEAAHAMNVLQAELTFLNEKCETNHATLRLVTVPFFPPQFYASQAGTNWSLHLGNYDFLVPDRAIAAFAREKNIPFLSFANWLRARPMDVAGVKECYLSNGSGHFSEQGHKMCAEAIFEMFYSKPNP